MNRSISSSKGYHFKPRLGGSVSDPLNLETWSDDNECSTCAPSPAGRDRQLGDQSLVPLPDELQHDPLNLEEKIDDFRTLVTNYQQNRSREQLHGRKSSSESIKEKRKRKGRDRLKSRSESSTTEDELNQSNIPFASNKQKPPFVHKAAAYRYGNYDQYYGYRNNGAFQEDVRMKVLQSEWFQGKDCLDIGSNTGQMTIAIARQFGPRKIVGIDIDSKLVCIASKNLHRHFVPTAMPDGRPFPLSLLMSCGPVNWMKKGDVGGFPGNVQFKQGNYIPISDKDMQRTKPEYDVILCLSLTKWVHLNWGDIGLKRMFQKIYHHLHPGGRLILEPQPWSSYSKRKKLTATIFENYKNIQFFPDQFHDYLMSSEVGFTQHQFLGISDNKSPGFQRPLHMYCKVPILPATLPTISISETGLDTIVQNQVDQISEDPVIFNDPERMETKGSRKDQEDTLEINSDGMELSEEVGSRELTIENSVIGNKERKSFNVDQQAVMNK